MNILWFLLPLTGTWAKEPPKDIYGLEGCFICMDVADRDIKDLKWMLKDDIIVKTNKTAPKYERKMVYYHLNYTLCIKNLTGNDSGLYSATYDKEWRQSTTEYKLTVQKAVPVPALLVTYSNSSTGPCNITVNCSGWELTVCRGGSCAWPQSLSQSDANISISSSNGLINCTVNNYVSRFTVSKLIEDVLCRGEMHGTSSHQLDTILYWCLGGFILVIAFVGIFYKTWKSPKKQQLQLNLRSVSPERPVPQPSTESEVTSIYVTAGKPRAAEVSAGLNRPVDKDRPEPKSPPQVEALSTVQPPVVNHPPVGKRAPTQVRPVPPRRPTESVSTSVYSTVEKPAVAHRHPVDKYGNNLSLPDTVYRTLGEFPLPPSQ